MLILKCRIRFILQCFVLFPQRFESWLLFFMNYFIASSNIQLYYQTNLSPNNSVDHSSMEKLHVYFSCRLDFVIVISTFVDRSLHFLTSSDAKLSWQQILLLTILILNHWYRFRYILHFIHNNSYHQVTSIFHLYLRLFCVWGRQYPFSFIWKGEIEVDIIDF